MPKVPQYRPDKMYLPKGWVRSNVTKRTPIDTNQLNPKYKLAQKKKRLAMHNHKPKRTTGTASINQNAYQWSYQQTLGRKIAKWVQE